VSGFLSAAWPWVAIGLFAAIATAYMDKLKELWRKWEDNSKNN